MHTCRSFIFFTILLLLSPVNSAAGQEKSKPFKISPADLEEPIIWGSTCESPDGYILAFGGQDQESDEPPRTRIKASGSWKSLSAELRRQNPLQELHVRSAELARRQKDLMARARAVYFRGASAAERRKEMESTLSEPQTQIEETALQLKTDLRKTAQESPGYAASQAAWGAELLAKCEALLDGGRPAQHLSRDELSEAVKAMGRLHIDIARVAEALDAEPPARYLSPLAYDSKTRRFVLTCGDHGDYLTNDLWLFDPAQQKWEQRRPHPAPPPRAGHSLAAKGDGTLTLRGGYRYTSSLSYLGAQYEQVNDGDWTYDIAANKWQGAQQGVSADTRVYRTGPFHPDYFLAGPPPDAGTVKKSLDAIAVNRWIEMRTPHKPEMVRTWGHAVLDPDHDQILIFSGGHSAHCGSDVLHYHLASNRWELPFPVEFPLGQTYTNTEYPEGYNLNRRPWMTGHTYQSYNYDPLSHKLYLNARVQHTYVYDPVVGDWTGRFSKPQPMAYHDCFYNLNTLPTPQGLYCWTGRGDLFKLASERQEWQEVPLKGAELPEAVVDASTYVYDAKRDRFLFFHAEYGKKSDGVLQIVERSSGQVKRHSPGNAAALAALDLKQVDRAVYDPEHDLVLFSSLLSGDDKTVRRALAYDCAADRWVSLAIGYEIVDDKRAAHPAGPGHSCGLLFDARRKLIWGIDTHNCRVYALRFDPKTADAKILEP